MTNQVDDIEVDGRYTITHDGSGNLNITDTVNNNTGTITSNGEFVGLSQGSENNPIQEMTIGKSAYEAAGGDLSAAVSSLTSEGVWHIIVREPPAGQSWTWDSDLSFDFDGDDFGLVLDIGDSVAIDYTGTGWALSINGSNQSSANVNTRSVIKGGRWSASNNATGWLRLIDSFRTRVNPSEVRMNGGKGVQIRNEDNWSESTHISGSYKDVAEGIEFVPASVTGGTGSDSFHDTYIEHLQVSASNYCLKLAGVFQYVHVDNPTLQVTSSAADCLVLDSSRTEGTVFTACKFESPANPGNTAAIRYGTNFDKNYGPLFLYARVGFGIDEDVRGGTPDPMVNLTNRNKNLRIEFIGGSGRFDLRENNLTFVTSNGNATLSVGSDGVLEVNDANGSRDL